MLLSDALSIENVTSCSFLRCSKTSTMIGIYFHKFLGKVAPLVCKNNLEVVLGSKSEKFESIET